MNPILTIATNDLRVFLKDKGGYVWLFVMPVVFIYLFGSAMTGSGEPSDPRVTVAVTNDDEGYLGALFVAQLEQEGFAISTGNENEEPVRTIRIPADFTQNVKAAKQVDVEFVQTTDSGAQPGAMVEVRITRAIVSLTSAIVAVVTESDGAALEESKLKAMLDRDKPVQLDVRFAGRREIPAGFQQSVPGYLVMFVLMNLLIFGGLAISQERSNGALRRLAMHPVSKTQIVVGKILGRFLLGVVQIVYLLLIGGFFFGMDYAGNLPLITLTMLVFAWGCASLGVFVGAIVRTPESVQGICTLGSIAMAAIGGCWWPLEIVPDFARRIGQLFPTSWAMNAMHQLISFGGGSTEIQHELLLIGGFAIVSSGLAARFLRTE